MVQFYSPYLPSFKAGATGFSSSNPEIITLRNGRSVVLWQNESGNGGMWFGGSVFQIVDREGNKIGAEVALPGIQHSRYADVAALANGGFVASWYAGGGEGWTQRYDQNGAAIGPIIVSNRSAPGNFITAAQVEALEGGAFVVLTQRYYSTSQVSNAQGIFVELYDASGASLRGPVLALSNPYSPYGPFAYRQLLALEGGGFVVAAATSDRSGSNISINIFDAAGVSISNSFLLEPADGLEVNAPQLTALEGGRFLVVWASSGNFNNAQILDGSGNKVGSSFHLIPPEGITTTENGDIVIVTTKSTTGVEGVHAHVYSPLGEPLQLDIFLGIGNFPEVTAYGGREFRVTWQLNGNILVQNLEAGYAPTIRGTDGNDDLGPTGSGSQGGSVWRIEALGGDDVVRTENGFSAGSYYNLGPGNDIIKVLVDTGTSYYEGGAGVDTFDISASNQVYDIDLDKTTWQQVDGSGGGPTILNFENVVGNSLDNVLYGSSANNVLSGASGFDFIDGRAGDDVLNGGDFDDEIYGGDGNDTLDGGADDDLLAGGIGRDLLTGGSGRDTFKDTAANFNGDTITDFSSVDRIIITNANFSTFSFSVVGSNLVFGGNSISLGTIPAAGIFATAALGGGVQLSSRPQADRNDFNGDGRSDLLWRNDNGTLTNWLGQRDGSFVGNYAAGVLSLPTGWKVLGTADFNGDGRSDVLWRHDNGTVTNWLAQLNGSFQGNYSKAAYAVDSTWKLAGTGDFNGDGRADVLWRKADGSVVSWSGNADGSFNASTASYQAGSGWNVTGTGDFNGDGRDDILWRNDNGTLTNWLGQADGSFAGNYAAGVLSLENTWKVVGTGDFNGDGRDDVLWRNDNGVLTNWLANANGSFTGNYANSAYQIDSRWQLALTGDVNGDGRDDIVWRNEAGAIVDWLANVYGGFSTSGIAPIAIDTTWQVNPGNMFVG